MYTVGQKIFIKHFGSWNWYYTPAVVAKVSPAGLVDVKFGYTLEDNANPPKRFLANGKIQKKKGVYESDYEIDTMPFDERVAALASEERAKSAAAALSLVKPEERIRAEWGKDGLLAEVARLQTLLDTARTAVEEI
jgi:hypothetical protein